MIKHVLQQALEALENALEWSRDRKFLMPYRVSDPIAASIESLRSALAQPEPLPPPPECQTEAEKTAYAFGWWKALEVNRAALAQPTTAAVLPNGKTATNVYEAYEIGKSEALTQQGEPVALMIVQENGRVDVKFNSSIPLPQGRTVVELYAEAAPAAQQGEQPVAWRTFDGEGGYDYRSYDDNENYAEEWAKRNPNHIEWVEPLCVGAAPAAPSKTLDWSKWHHDLKPVQPVAWMVEDTEGGTFIFRPHEPVIHEGEKLTPLYAVAPAAQPVAVKAWAYGGSTGVNDYLMSDGSIKTMRPDEVTWAAPAAQPVNWTGLVKWWESGNEDFQTLKQIVSKMLATAPAAQPMTEPLTEPESFEQWNAKQHGDPEEIGFLQALRIAYLSGQDSVTRAHGIGVDK